MEYRQLGRTDINVSAICLGTMTFGKQNTESEGHLQLDRALEAGINFIDTAEMYPVPPEAETQGLTESYIGSWLAKRGSRDKVIIASKVVGSADWLPYMRGGNPRLNRPHMEAAIDASLKRLGTDVIDIYQLHWPDRNTNYFGKLNYKHQPDAQTIPIAETLEVLHDLIKAGKIRHYGLSNETPWGTMQFIRLAEEMQIPRPVSIQNPYNLLNRTFEIGLSEIAHNEDIGLLAYSPMAFGMLSGKYLGDTPPPDGRITLFERFSRYSNEQSVNATRHYVELARSHGLDPAQMALAYVTNRPFVTSNIIGATTMAQLETNLDSFNLTLDDEVLEGIEAIHTLQPNPAP
jgi:aryl-alcohol dehydrogenase-like predicted oxidoreductase